MLDDLNTDRNEFARLYSFLGRVFDLPIAEITDANHNGIIYFSKIYPEKFIMNFERNEIEYILEPVEIRYTELSLERDRVIWRRRKKDFDNIFRYKKAILRWFDREDISYPNVFDYGPLSLIMKKIPPDLSIFELEANLGVEKTKRNDINVEFIKNYEENEMKKKIRKMKKLSLSKIKKHKFSFLKEKIRNKFMNQN